jgi:hypothetical protein
VTGTGCRPRTRLERERVVYCGIERCFFEVSIRGGVFRYEMSKRLVTTDSSRDAPPCPPNLGAIMDQARKSLMPRLHARDKLSVRSALDKALSPTDSAEITKESMGMRCPMSITKPPRLAGRSPPEQTEPTSGGLLPVPEVLMSVPEIACAAGPPTAADIDEEGRPCTLSLDVPDTAPAASSAATSARASSPAPAVALGVEARSQLAAACSSAGLIAQSLGDAFRVGNMDGEV